MKHVWVFAGPATGRRVIRTNAKSHQTRVRIVNTSGAAEWLEPRVGIHHDSAKLVVVEPLRDRTVNDVDYETRTAQVIRYDSIGPASFHHVGRNVPFHSVHEPAHN